MKYFISYHIHIHGTEFGMGWGVRETENDIYTEEGLKEEIVKIEDEKGTHIIPMFFNELDS